MNLPNALTIGRLMLAPVVVVLVVVSDGGSMVAAALFVLLAATDTVDGHLARSRDDVTRFGTLADPVADKLLVLPVLFALVALDRLAAWVAIAILVREIAVSALRFVARRRGTIIAASPFGKLKMGSQVATVTILIAVADPGAAWVLALVYVTVGLTVVSGVDYYLNYRRAERRPVRRARPTPVEATSHRPLR